MIRQRVDRHGNNFHLEPESELPACNIPASEVGVIKEGPVKKWMAAKKEWDTKFASAKRRVQKQRAKEMAQGYSDFGNGEAPPPSALAGRRMAGEDLKEEKKKRSMGMSLWALWGSKHDEKTMALEQEADKADKPPETAVASAEDGANARPLDDTKTNQGKAMEKAQRPPNSRSRSRRKAVIDEHQTGDDVDENTPAFDLLAIRSQQADAPRDDHLAPTFATRSPSPLGPGLSSSSSTNPPPTIIINRPAVEEYDLKRPKADGIAFPFSLKGHQSSASMTTLTSAVGIPPTDDIRISGVLNSGVPHNQTDIEAVKQTANGGAVVSEAVKADEIVNESKGKEKVVENGEVVSAERPPIETFVTAPDISALAMENQK